MAARRGRPQSWGCPGIETPASVCWVRRTVPPYLLYGDAAWRMVGPGPGGRIGLPAARAGVAAAMVDLFDGMFRGRWNRASPSEQQYLFAMATHLVADGSASTGQVAAALGRSPT